MPENTKSSNVVVFSRRLRRLQKGCAWTGWTRSSRGLCRWPRLGFWWRRVNPRNCGSLTRAAVAWVPSSCSSVWSLCTPWSHQPGLSSSAISTASSNSTRSPAMDNVICYSLDSNYTHTHTFNGPLSMTTRVSRYQKSKTNLDFTEARDSEWQWHQLGYMQVCTSLQTNNHTSTPPLSFLQAGFPSCRPNQQRQSTEGVKHWRHLDSNYHSS